MKLKTISVEELGSKTTEEITADLRNDRYSLLASMGFTDLRKEMHKVGIICRKLLKSAERRARKRGGDYSQAIRHELSKTLSWGTPTEVKGIFPHPNIGLVFGFNHPTLGEIIRLIDICMTEYPKRSYLFPVNIAWYEELAPIGTRMEALGIHIVPIITPSTREKIRKRSSDENMAIIDKIAAGFNSQYGVYCEKFIRENNIVLVAPSATRKATVFSSTEEMSGTKSVKPQTMTFIALSLIHSGAIENCCFLPIAVIPPEKASRSINLFRKYRIIPGEWFSSESVVRLCKPPVSVKRGRKKFEWYFLDAIAQELSEAGASRLIVP